jgi:alpha-beta hydrolase superfamily lysophospholipase
LVFENRIPSTAATQLRFPWFILLLLFASPAASAQMPPAINSSADALRAAQTISDRHGTIVSADQTCLFYRYWPAESPGNRIVLVLHGIGYHSGPYKVIAGALNPRGIDVYGIDARGHGLSCGRRGYLGIPAQAAEDVSAMVHFLKQQHPSARLYLLGESMGGALALNYMKDSRDIGRLILLAPALNVNSAQLFRLGNLPLLPFFLFARRHPAISLVGKRLDESSRDPQWIAERQADPLAYKKVSFGYLGDIKALVKDWRTQIAPRVHVPTLIIQGEQDRIVSQKDCREFPERLAATDKTFKTYANVRHTTLWDPETPAILDAVRQWIEAH